MNHANYKILIVDDEPDIVEFLSYNFKKEGYIVAAVKDGLKAIKLAQDFLPDLILLDVMMPNLNGFETCKKLRRLPNFSETLIIFLTARGEDYNEVTGFEVGADDYISKPIRLRTLIARVKSLLNRRGVKEILNQNKIFGSLSIDAEKRKITLDGHVLNVTKKEFEILLLLSSKPEKVFSREEIYSKIWGGTIIVGDRTLDVHIRKLREKIGSDFIKTSKGVGYAFVFNSFL